MIQVQLEDGAVAVEAGQQLRDVGNLGLVRVRYTSPGNAMVVDLLLTADEAEELRDLLAVKAEAARRQR